VEIAQIIILILIVLFPVGELARLQYGSIAVTISDFFAATLLIIFLYQQRKHAFFSIKKISVIQPLIFFLLIGFLSLVSHYVELTLEPWIISFAYAVRFISYSSIFFVLAQSHEQFKNKVIHWMIVSGAITVLIGFLQYIFFPDLRGWFYLGWDKHLYRMFSSFLDPNFSGVYFVLYLLFLLGIFFERKHFKKPLLLIFMTCTFFAVFLSYSRSALLMLALSLPLLLYLLKKIKLLGVFLIGAVCLFVIVSYLWQSEGTNLLRTTSSLSRIDSAEKAITIAKDNFLTGVGFNAYRYAQKKYGFLEEDSWEMLHSGAGTDNSFLFVIATTGIFGYCFYMYFWYKVICSNLDHKTIFSSVVVVSVLGLFVGSLFVNSLFFAPIMQWMWLLLGVTYEEKG
jgi:hypothetical protein